MFMSARLHIDISTLMPIRMLIFMLISPVKIRSITNTIVSNRSLAYLNKRVL